MAWTSEKKPRKATLRTLRCAFAHRPHTLLLTLATSPLLVPDCAFSRENPTFSPPTASENERYFRAQPDENEVGESPTIIKNPQESASSPLSGAAASVYDLPTVLNHPPMPLTEFIAPYDSHYNHQGTNPAELQSFLMGINQLLAAHGKATIAGFELPQKAHAVLTISKLGPQLQISPPVINLEKIGHALRVSLEGFTDLAPQLFVRDQHLLQWNDFTKQLTAIGEGHTEVYVHFHSGMHILPISIGSSPGGTTEIAAVETLTPMAPLGGGISGGTIPLFAQQPQLKPRGAVGSEPLAFPSGEFQLRSHPVAYTTLALRIVDERSRFDEGKEPPAYFPAAGVTIKLIGTDFSAETDSQGMIKEFSIPTNSRLMVALSDQSGVFLPAVHEILSDEAEAKGILTLKIMRRALHEQLLSVAELLVDGRLGSLCGIARGNDRRPLAGISVGIDWDGVKPIYFNGFGLPDLTAQTTADNGRFCFLNVPEGPAAVSFVDHANTQTLAVEPHTFFAGHHAEKFFALDESSEFTTHLASYSTPRGPLGEAHFSYQSVEMVDLWPFGFGDAFKPVAYGTVAAAQTMSSTNQRAYYLAQAKDFEQTLYQYDGNQHSAQEQPVTPLFPLGFIDTMMQTVQEQSGGYIPHDLSQGNVIVEHGTQRGEEGLGQARIKLFTHHGTEVSEAVYFGESPLRKAMFFNVPPGNYQVVVESSEGHWLAVNTLVVYGETLSYLRTGSPTVFASPYLTGMQ